LAHKGELAGACQEGVAWWWLPQERKKPALQRGTKITMLIGLEKGKKKGRFSLGGKGDEEKGALNVYKKNTVTFAKTKERRKGPFIPNLRFRRKKKWGEGHCFNSAIGRRIGKMDTFSIRGEGGGRRKRFPWQ